MSTSKSVLDVRMLGGFEMSLDGNPVVLNTGVATKATQVLQYIIHSYPAPTPAAVLVQKIFGTDEIINPRNNMKVTISQLRKLLSAAGLPGNKYISISNGSYYWNCPVQLRVDTHDFLHLLKLAKAESDHQKKIHLYYQCIDLYRGNFLPMLEYTEWALAYNVYYADQFADAVRSLVKLLKAEHRWTETLSLAEKAYSLLRTDEWQILRIECLMSLGRWEDAKRGYDDAVSTLSREFDLPPTEALLAAYNQISKHTVDAFSSLNDMMACVHEPEQRRGAYQSTFLGFIDLYRVMVRSMMRQGTVYCLMLCTLADRERHAVQNEERLALAAERTSEAIRLSLRSGDFYAQYNKCQFVICLSNTSLDNCPMIAERIQQTYRNDPVRGIHLYFESKPAKSLDGFVSDSPSWK